MIAEDSGSPFYRPRSRRPVLASQRSQPQRAEPPTHINLPSPYPPPTSRRPSATREKKAVGSPKLSGWAFLKRAAGPSSLPPLAPPTSSTRPLSAAPQPTLHQLQSASSVSSVKRPGNSRSTTFTDTLPTTRALTLDPTVAGGPAPAQAHPTTSQPYYPPSPHTAAPHPTVPTPPIVVVPSVLAPQGKFGLFRRPSLKAKVERTGFFAGLVSPSAGSVGDLAGVAAHGPEKKRLKGLGKKKRASLGGPSSSGSPSPSGDPWGSSTLSPPQPAFAPSTRFASGSSSHSSFQRPSSPLSPYYQAPDPSYRHTAYPAGSPVHSPSPTLYHTPASPSRGPNAPSSPRQPVIPDRTTSVGRPTFDFPSSRPPVGHPAASGSVSSLSAAEADDDEEFPFRTPRPAKVASSKRKHYPNSQRGRSCSPSRLSIVDGPVPIAGDGAPGTSPVKTARAWWKLAVDGGGLPSTPDKSSRGSGLLGSSAPTPRASVDSADNVRKPTRGSTLEHEPRVVERGFTVVSRPDSPAAPLRRDPSRGNATPESSRSSVLVVRNGPLPNDDLLASPPPASSSPSPHQTPPRNTTSPMVSRANSLASPRSNTRGPSRSNSINRSWTPPVRAPPKPPSTPGSSRPNTPSRMLNSISPIPAYHRSRSPTPALPTSRPQSPSSSSFLGAVPDPRFVEYPPLPPSPLFFHSDRDDRVSPTFSSSDSSGRGGHSADATLSQTTFAGTTTEADTEEDDDEMLTSEAETCPRGGMSLVDDGAWKERRWSVLTGEMMEEAKVRG